MQSPGKDALGHVTYERHRPEQTLLYQLIEKHYPALIEREKISMLPGPPTIYQSILAHPGRGNFDLSSLRLASTGAARSTSW